MPVFIIVILVDDVQKLVTVTGGVFGGFILLLIPAFFVHKIRLLRLEEKYGKNPYCSPY